MFAVSLIYFSWILRCVYASGSLLHPDHIPYVVNEGGHCWGYEDDTLIKCEHLYSKADCSGSPGAWAQSASEQRRIFNEQADFGYVKKFRHELHQYVISEASENGSSLECTQYTRFCRGKNVYIDFRSNLRRISEPMKYRGDVLSDGEIGGFNCHVRQKELLSQSAHKSPLQSWFDEIEHFECTQDRVECDVTVSTPVYLMKLDATSNLYHHYCDFINLYLTMHLNGSLDKIDNNRILIWDTYRYWSNFAPSWKAFTSQPLLDLSEYKGKRVCFNDLVFSLLPRMIFGMYYNMPLISGCSGSGVFHSFSQHMKYKLDIKDEFNYTTDNNESFSKQIRVTLISRATKFRRILNEYELVEALKKKSANYQVNVVDFGHHKPFLEQMHIIANTDILIGMHGAGLTHCLFLPDYGALFELYNCDDENCYKDLANLRGVKYITWTNESLVEAQEQPGDPGPAHKKFTNYRFDVNEFIRIVQIASRHVKEARTNYARSVLGLSLHSKDEL